MPQKIGRYQITRELGQGGMATVYLAFDSYFERKVAIKVLPSQFTHDPRFLERFEQEAKMIAALEDAAIVPVHDFGEDEGWPYLVMRYMPGGTLGERIEEGRGMDLEEVCPIFDRLAPALDKAHAKGIIHRDLKPDNVLFDGEGRPYLADFGIARMADATRTITLQGTPAYMSPEQAEGDVEPDGRSDIYSLGVMLYEMLTGQRPYVASTPTKQIIMHILQPVPDVLAANPDLPPNTQSVIDKVMAKDREERYQTAVELAAALHHLILASSPAAEPFPLAIPVLSDFEQPSASAGLPSEATDTEMDAETSPGALVPEQIDEAISDSTVDDKIPDISPKPVALQGPAPQKRARLPAWVWFAAAAVLILLVVGLYWVFVGGRNGDQHPSQLQGGTLIVGGECRSEDVLCVGLVTGVGEIDDKSFNQSAWEGVQQTASELGAQVAFIETKDALDFAENIAQFGDEGYDVIVTVGFEMTEATAKAAQEYPDTNFVGVDQFHPESIDNLATLIFDESKAGFLAGALAAILTESNTVAAVLGTDLVPQIKAFKEGFESGAMYVSPDINLILTYHPGAVDAAFTDPEWGANTARQALDQGADVIFAAAGQTGNSALIETAAAKGALCIGAATDQWQTFPEARPCLVSSAMKLVTPGVFDMIKMSTEGEFPTGQFAGEVSLAPFRNLSDIVAQDVSAKIAEIEARIQDGTIRID